MLIPYVHTYGITIIMRHPHTLETGRPTRSIGPIWVYYKMTEPGAITSGNPIIQATF